MITIAKGKYQEWLTEDNLLIIQGWARDGLTDDQIAHNMGINVKTLWDWRNKYDPICKAIKKGKAPVDLEVENALLKRALGYEYEEVTTETVEGGKPKTKRVKKHMPPDTTAQIFWLKNRRPDKWRDKIEQVQSVDNELLQSLIDLEQGATNG